jgi:hypothetical protein
VREWYNQLVNCAEPQRKRTPCWKGDNQFKDNYKDKEEASSTAEEELNQQLECYRSSSIERHFTNKGKEENGLLQAKRGRS